VLPTLNLDGDGFEIETIMNVRALRANLKVVEVPSFEDRRRYGEGRLRTIPDGWRVLKAIFREWLKPPRRFVRRIEVRTGSSHQGTAADEVARLARDIEVEAS
jgi:hypothetical protein